MTKSADIISDVVKLHHHYQATPAQVFEAWSNPQALGQWFGPHSHTCRIEKFDFREGGAYQIRMIPIAEDTNTGERKQGSVCAGKFVQIAEQKKIVMTFSWIENATEIGDTLLTIDIAPEDVGTTVVLTHERLPTEQTRKAHSGGWRGTLECLEEYLQGEKVNT